MQELFLLVDGYNMIGAWGHLKEIKKKSLERARELLVEDLTVPLLFPESKASCHEPDLQMH